MNTFVLMLMDACSDITLTVLLKSSGNMAPSCPTSCPVPLPSCLQGLSHCPSHCTPCKKDPHPSYKIYRHIFLLFETGAYMGPRCKQMAFTVSSSQVTHYPTQNHAYNAVVIFTTANMLITKSMLFS